MTSTGTPTRYRVGPVRNTFCTLLSHPPLTPQASLQLLASLELVAMEGEATPSPRYSLDFEASSQETRSASSAPDSPSTASMVSCSTEGHAASPPECYVLCVNYLSPVPEPTGVFNLRSHKHPNLCGQVGPA